MNGKWFRWFFVGSVVIGALLVSLGFAEIHSTAVTLHTLVVHNQIVTLESAKARVTTVSQRCDLTHKITEVLVKDDPRRVHAFQVSYHSCLKQLAEVRAIFEKAKS